MGRTAAVARTDTDTFTGFVERVGPRLKHALISSLGGEVGREATAEALAWAWEHWDRLTEMDNPAGYLYRVGRSRGVGMYRRRRRETAAPHVPTTEHGAHPFEPGLPGALERLSQKQRAVVVLIHGYGWTYREVAGVLGIAAGSVQKHEERGMRRLRSAMKVDVDA
jgi:RNA polymerase sigma-70 factor (ECF subfamily)